MPRTPRSRWMLAGCLLFLAVFFGALALVVIGAEVGVNGFVAGFLMAAVPVPFYVAFALWVDRFEPEPNGLLAIAFLWGATIAVFFSMLFNALNEGLFTALAGAQSASALSAVLSAPLVEEFAKGSALVMLFLGRRDEFDNVTDGIVYAAMIGLGFAMTENVLYYGRATIAPEGQAGIVFFLRGVMSPFAHPLFTSMTGIGLGIARETGRKSTKWLAPLAGLAGAVLLHAVWNLAANFGAVFFAAYLLIMVPTFLGVIVVALFSLRRETRVIRTHLAAVVAEGILSDDDLVVVTSVRARLRASTRALLTGGVRRWIARRRFHALATELAFHAWRSSREPAHDAQVMHEALVAEIGRVRGAMN